MVTGRIRFALWLLVFLLNFCLGVRVYTADTKPKNAPNRLIYEKSPYPLKLQTGCLSEAHNGRGSVRVSPSLIPAR